MIFASITLLFAAVSAVQSDLPVFLFNTQTSVTSGSSLSDDESQVLLSHFVGDGKQPYLESIASTFPSEMFSYSDSKPFVIKNLNEDDVLNTFGSPLFYINRNASHYYTTDESVRTIDFKSNEFKSLLNQMRSDISTRYMVVAMPGTSETGGNNQQLHSRAAVSASVSASAFDSEEQCLSSTDRCSSHGTCVLKSNGKYGCKCQSTVIDGKRYSWGGKDCAKHDVSFQFNLILGTTLAIVTAGVLSVGLLYNLGSEPIPSILNTSTL